MVEDVLFLQNEFIALSNEYALLRQRQQERELLHSSELDHGNSALMLFSCALVMLMTLPGISLFYAGAVKIRHVLSTFVTCMAVSSSVSVLWMICGYSLAFAPAVSSGHRETSIFGDFSRFWLQNLHLDSVHQSAPFVSETMFCMFQLSNAIISCALIVGGFACRVKFLHSLLFVCLWLLLIYCPLSHSHRHPDGFLFKADVLDYAGGNVVHISAGMTAFVTSILIGPSSKEHSPERIETRNMLLSVWGACFLWIGWFGFNVGSGFSANGNAAMTVLITVVGAAGAVISWTSTEWIVAGRPSVLGMLSGGLSGLVSISAGVGYIDITGAFVIGFVTGIICYFATTSKDRVNRLRFEDPLGTFIVNFIGGVVGGFLLGFFADESNGDFHHPNGAFYGNPKQIYLQLYGIVFTSAWTAVMTVVIFLLVDKGCGGMRVPEVHETIGLDIASHGQTILAMPKRKLADLIRKCESASAVTGRGHDGDGDLGLDVINHGDELDDDDGRTEQLDFDEDGNVARPRRFKSKSILIGDTGEEDDDDEIRQAVHTVLCR